MVKFRALMEAIQQSINSAARSVEANGVRYVNKFFVEVDEDGEPKTKTENSTFNLDATYRPKMVDMEFPSRTPDGIETVSVKVPLLTLSPLNTPKVEQVKFTADLEVSTNEQDELLVAFPQTKKPSLFSSSSANEKSGNAHLEIIISAGEAPEGLQKIIEGYERALRAQIPG